MTDTPKTREEIERRIAELGRKICSRRSHKWSEIEWKSMLDEDELLRAQLASLDEPKVDVEQHIAQLRSGHLVRDTSTPEKRAWWAAIDAAAKNAPKLRIKEQPPRCPERYPGGDSQCSGRSGHAGNHYLDDQCLSWADSRPAPLTTLYKMGLTDRCEWCGGPCHPSEAMCDTCQGRGSPTKPKQNPVGSIGTEGHTAVRSERLGATEAITDALKILRKRFPDDFISALDEPKPPRRMLGESWSEWERRTGHEWRPFGYARVAVDPATTAEQEDAEDLALAHEALAESDERVPLKEVRRKLERNLSTPELREWWAAVDRAAASAPVLHIKERPAPLTPAELEEMRERHALLQKWMDDPDVLEPMKLIHREIQTDRARLLEAYDALHRQAFDSDVRLRNENKRLTAELAEAKERIQEYAECMHEDDLPRCCGEWLGGSGGHRRHGPCDRLATRFQIDDSVHYCDEHYKAHDNIKEVAWAPLIRELAESKHRAAERARDAIARRLREYAEDNRQAAIKYKKEEFSERHYWACASAIDLYAKMLRALTPDQLLEDEKDEK